WRLYQDRRRRPTILYSFASSAAHIAQPLKARFRWVPMALKTLALVLAILALARPQRANTKIKRSAEGIDIMICWDISDSMLIEDMPPDENRMDSAKQTIK